MVFSSTTSHGETHTSTILCWYDWPPLQQKAEDVLPYLNDRCVYLVGQFLTPHELYTWVNPIIWYCKYNSCIQLYTGMMGSGKTTVGKIIAEVLGYSFFDRFECLSHNCSNCWTPIKTFFELNSVDHGLVILPVFSFHSDKLVEQAVGIPTVAEIFQVHSEAFFRDNEVRVYLSWRQ
jgi:shikimate kinase